MRASNLLVEFLKEVERFEPRRYDDGAGVMTIGYGHAIRSGESFEEPMTEAEAEALLRKDLSVAERAVSNLVAVPLTQGQFDALVSLTFNVGSGTIESSGLLEHLNRGEYDEALRRLRMYNKMRVKGKLVVSSGLDWRRRMESVLWGAG